MLAYREDSILYLVFFRCANLIVVDSHHYALQNIEVRGILVAFVPTKTNESKLHLGRGLLSIKKYIRTDIGRYWCP